MFSGVFQHSIDAKGRTSLPARFRELLLAQGADKLFITPDLIDPCLVAFAPSAWQRLAEKVAAKSMFDRDIRLLSRAFIAPAQECPVDKLGRILASTWAWSRKSPGRAPWSESRSGPRSDGPRCRRRRGRRRHRRTWPGG